MPIINLITMCFIFQYYTLKISLSDDSLCYSDFASDRAAKYFPNGMPLAVVIIQTMFRKVQRTEISFV